MTHWYQKPCQQPCQQSADKARARQAVLTKPAGSLGVLETIAIQFAAWQKKERAHVDQIMIRVFAADHGVYAQNVSAFPQEVTMQMILNFLNGGAAISVLSEREDAHFSVVNMGIATPLPMTDAVLKHPKLINIDIAQGTADFSVTTAMTEAQTDQALATGQHIISRHLNESKRVDLFIGGEMGIANTTSASAIYCALLGISAIKACGPGTGLDSKGVAHKAKVIEDALQIHFLNHSDFNTKVDAYDVLKKLGGFEIAGLVGAYIAAAQHQIPSLIDGFISTAAALIASELNPSCRDWFMFSHQSAEPAHILALKHMNAKPLLDFGMRLGEGSGAAVCIPLLKSALTLHQQMATFEEAAIAGQSL